MFFFSVCSSRVQTPSPVLVSPKVYEETSKSLNNQLGHNQNKEAPPRTPIYEEMPPNSSGNMANFSATSHESSHRSSGNDQPTKQEPYVPPFLRAPSSRAKREAGTNSMGQAQDAKSPMTSPAQYVPPPPGFAPLPSLDGDESRNEKKKLKAKEESRADTNTNWRQKAQRTEEKAQDITNNGKLVSLGKVSKKDKPVVSLPQDETKSNYRQILNETEFFIEHSKDSLKMSSDSPPSQPPASNHISVQDFPPLSESLGVKQKKASQQHTSRATHPMFVPPPLPVKQENGSPPLSLQPTFTASLGGVRKCGSCGSTAHATYKCPERAEKFFVH